MVVFMSKSILIFVVLITVSGCATQKQKLFDGLTENSYGVLTDKDITVCNTDNYDYAVSKDVDAYLHTGIQSLVHTIIPVEGKVDKTILEEELQNNFKIPGDPGGASYVVLLKRNHNEIVFWYTLGVVLPDEVYKAANEFCGKHKKKALLRGSSKKCSESKPSIIPIAINNVQPQVQSTYVISSFQCI